MRSSKRCAADCSWDKRQESSLPAGGTADSADFPTDLFSAWPVIDRDELRGHGLLVRHVWPCLPGMRLQQPQRMHGRNVLQAALASSSNLPASVQFQGRHEIAVSLIPADFGKIPGCEGLRPSARHSQYQHSALGRVVQDHARITLWDNANSQRAAAIENVN